MRLLVIVLSLLIGTPAFGQVKYLAPYEGVGTDANPFRAIGMGPGVQCKSLRPSETQVAGFAYCDGPVLPAHPDIIAMTGKKTPSVADKGLLLKHYGRGFTALTHDELLNEIVDSQNTSLRVKGGRQSIMVKGEEVWSRPAPLRAYLPDVLHALDAAFHLPMHVMTYAASTAVAYAASTITETWTAADQDADPTVADHTWSRYQGTNVEVVSNQLKYLSTTTLNLMYNSSTSMDDDDMQHQFTIISLGRDTATSVGGAPTVRHSAGAPSTYIYCLARDASTDEIDIGHVSAGTTTVDGTANVTVASSDTLITKVVGDQISCVHNGSTVLGPLTENTGAGNLRIGLRFAAVGTASASTQITIDDNVATLIVSGTGVFRRRGVSYEAN